jgi:hypothetical protein
MIDILWTPIEVPAVLYYLILLQLVLLSFQKKS